MIYSPGDFLDKYSIIVIKNGKNLNVHKEMLEMKPEFSNLIFNKEVETLYYVLLESNAKQYEMEDQIRVEPNLLIVGQIALDIRRQNDYRVELKNKINEVVGYKFKEIKDYKTA